MLIAHYIGDHAGDAFPVRMGWALTRLVQKGNYGRVTHCEAIHAVNADRTTTIASSSLRDGGVRIKHGVQLAPGNWLIADVEQWPVGQSRTWFGLHAGEQYDSRGAVATVLPGHHKSGEWFCNESVGASVGLLTPECFTPAQFAAVCFTFGRDVTAEFFNGGVNG